MPTLVLAGLVGVAVGGTVAEIVGRSAPSTVAVATVVVAEDAVSAAGSTSFTLRQLAAGEVPASRFNAVWQREVDEVLAAPCSAAVPAPGGTTVVLTVGATPPPGLGDEYLDWAPRLAAARAEHAAACAGG